jgi:type IV secretion system protein VirB5
VEKIVSNPQRVYLEQHASTVVMNNYLKVALLVVVGTLVASLGLSFSIFYWAKTQKPLIVRVSEVGRAEVVNYADFSHRPGAPEFRYFLANFTRLHFSRLLGSPERQFSDSLYFLEVKLAQAVADEERKRQSITKFTREGSEEVDIEIRNVVLQDLRSRPMKATVDFDKVIYQRGERRVLRREQFTASFQFSVQESVPNSFTLVNPLGLIVTYFHVDEAFTK